MKVLIVDEMHPSIIEMPRTLGLEVDYLPTISLDEFKKILLGYEGLIIRSKFYINQELLQHAPKLKFIGRAGAGLDLIDLDACKKYDIAVFAANEGNRIAVAEHLIGMLLTLFNNINRADAEVKAGIWNREENRGVELYGKKVGLIGFGNNGEATASRLIAFGCEILAYDKYRYGFGNQFVKECTMREIFYETDILSLHTPLTPATVKMVNTDFINKFRKPFYFCNVARGEIADLTDVVAALQTGKIKGACLDVLENERINKLNEAEQRTFDALRQLPNVVLTPHVAGWTHQSYRRINEVLRDKIGRFLQID